MCNCDSGNGCRFCYSVDTYGSELYCKYLNDYFEINEVDNCDHYQELRIPSEEEILIALSLHEGCVNG